MEKISIKIPSISIITINLNNSNGLESTILSVIRQNYHPMEFIIIDGGSSDESVDIIRKYNNKITSWISESDKGIYNAMNKGIIRATGDYCYFLNSGDVFHDENTLKNIINYDLLGDIISFKVMVNEGEKGMKIVIPPNEISFYTFFIHTIIHQAVFIRRTLFEKFGLYNEQKKITSDWEFFVQVLILNNCSYQTVPVIISIFKADGLSSSPDNSSICTKERDELLQEYFSKYLSDYELIKTKSTYFFLKNLQKHPLLKSVFSLITKIINKILKIFEF